MKRIFLSTSLLALAAAAGFGQTAYSIDPQHSGAAFSVKHMMVSNVKGSFSGVTGTAVWDPKNLGASKIEATIDVSTVDTRQAKRDAHLKSPDFFDAAQFPQMKFQSTRFERRDGKLFIAGGLTLRGVTKPVVLEVSGPSEPVKDPYGNIRLGASAATRINRKDFGILWNSKLDGGGAVVADDVDITLDVEMIQKK